MLADDGLAAWDTNEDNVTGSPGMPRIHTEERNL